MEAVSLLIDHRIHAHNALFEMSIQEYLDLTRTATDKNPYQRKRISSSKTIYALLRGDIIAGCIIPPVVLALRAEITQNIAVNKDSAAELVKAHSGNLLILDGLQRTFTLLDIESSLKDDAVKLQEFYDRPLRVEVYLGLNKIGILYRMLTLNTGQTPMSLRQQIEMLYSDYIDSGVENVEFLREVDGENAAAENQLNFRDTIEGFNSYLERDELPLDRSDLLENIKSLENLSHENASTDLFREYVAAWIAFFHKALEVCAGAQFILEKEAAETAAPWGKTATQVFRRTQAMAGFGAAVGKLKDHEILSGLGAIPNLCAGLRLDGDAESFLAKINADMYWINKSTKKIGSAQRMFFQFYFRDLFNKESDTYLSLDSSLSGAMRKLQSQLL